MMRSWAPRSVPVDSMCVDSARGSWETGKYHHDDLGLRKQPLELMASKVALWQAFIGSENVSGSRRGEEPLQKFTDQQGSAHRLLLVWSN